MSSSVLRFFGAVFILGAVVLMILNLKRVANLGTFCVALPVLIIGIVLVTRARKAG